MCKIITLYLRVWVQSVYRAHIVHLFIHTHSLCTVSVGYMYTYIYNDIQTGRLDYTHTFNAETSLSSFFFLFCFLLVLPFSSQCLTYKIKYKKIYSTTAVVYFRELSIFFFSYFLYFSSFLFSQMVGKKDMKERKKERQKERNSKDSFIHEGRKWKKKKCSFGL